MLLTFNLMVNINNNINNNNNNNNDNNLNAVDQNSQNTVTNTNAANQISVTVLPIPGKRSFRKLRSVASCPNQDLTNTTEESIAAIMFSQLVSVYSKLEMEDNSCHSYNFCVATKNLLQIFELEDIVSIDLLKVGINPSLGSIPCKQPFSNCA